jgi:hypothetical protein
VASRRSRETAYGDLLTALLDVRLDPATDRFDAELEAAEADGRIDPATARVLRWWQRESLRSMLEHTRTVVPPTLIALEKAAGRVDDEVEAASESWARVAGDDAPPTPNRHSRVPAPKDDEPATQITPPADLSEHRRRMLVAGLTRKPREQ